MAIDVKLFDRVESAALDAGAALDRDRQPFLFDRLEWYRLVEDHTMEGDPLVIRVRNGVARCWLFLSARNGEAEAMANWYTLRYGPVVEGAPEARPPFAGFSRGLRRAGISRIFLEPIGEDDPLAGTLRRQGWAVSRAPIDVNWRIDTKGMSFEQYWESRSSKLRNTTARRARKAKLRIDILDRFDAQGWDDYVSVYEASWKPAEGSPALARRFAEQEGAAGTLRLGLAYREGQSVAAQLWTVENGIATIHKLAYREDARDWSPGTVLSMEMFRRALDVDRVDTIDFGIGDHPYKAEWMTHKVPLYALTAYDLLRPAGIAGLFGAVWRKLRNRLRGS